MIFLSSNRNLLTRGVKFKPLLCFCDAARVEELQDKKNEHKEKPRYFFLCSPVAGLVCGGDSGEEGKVNKSTSMDMTRENVVSRRTVLVNYTVMLIKHNDPSLRRPLSTGLTLTRTSRIRISEQNQDIT